MNIVFLGSPGAGKGTQAARLALQKNFAHISTGEILRAQLAECTPLGEKAKQYMDRGEFVPDELVVDMVNHKLSELKGFSGCLLDGFPRNISQAFAMEGKISVDHAIYLEVDEQEVISRLSSRRTCRECGRIQGMNESCETCGGATFQRDDDRQDVVEKRLSIYKQQTMPLIDYYKKMGVLQKIDGSKSVDEVYSCILSSLEK